MADQPAAHLSTIQSADKLLGILFAFTEAHPRWRVNDLARHLGMHPSTVSRLLSTAKRHGVVRQDPNTGEYDLGLRILSLSQVIMDRLNPVQVAFPFLSALSASSGANSFLSVLDGFETVTVAQAASAKFEVVRPSIGQRMPLNCTAVGKLLLAHSSEQYVEAVIARGLTRRTKRSIVVRDDLWAELQRVRQQGYAIADREFQDDLITVAAPVRDVARGIIAAVAASRPAQELQGECLQDLVHQTCEAGMLISHALGVLLPMDMPARILAPSSQAIS